MEFTIDTRADGTAFSKEDRKRMRREKNHAFMMKVGAFHFYNGQELEKTTEHFGLINGRKTQRLLLEYARETGLKFNKSPRRKFDKAKIAAYYKRHDFAFNKTMEKFDLNYTQLRFILNKFSENSGIKFPVKRKHDEQAILKDYNNVFKPINEILEKYDISEKVLGNIRRKHKEKIIPRK